MKVIKAKWSNASEKASGLLKGDASKGPADRVLVVYGESSASIYYESPPLTERAASRPN